eukprot:4675670-Amphidinium_carterae.1
MDGRRGSGLTFSAPSAVPPSGSSLKWPLRNIGVTTKWSASNAGVYTATSRNGKHQSITYLVRLRLLTAFYCNAHSLDFRNTCSEQPCQPRQLQACRTNRVCSLTMLVAFSQAMATRGAQPSEQETATQAENAGKQTRKRAAGVFDPPSLSEQLKARLLLDLFVGVLLLRGLAPSSAGL